MGVPIRDMQTTEGEPTEAGKGTGTTYSVGELEEFPLTCCTVPCSLAAMSTA